MGNINRKAQRSIDKDVRENHALYAALAGCSCEDCEGEDWYIYPEEDQDG